MKSIGFVFTSLSLALLLLWFGVFKFTPAEAKGIEGLISSSPLMRWMYRVFSVAAISGIIEITAGLCLIAGLFLRPFRVIGSGLSALIFLITCSFLFSTPDVIGKVDGLWITTDSESFLIKDLVALGASLMLLSDALQGTSAQ